MGNTPYIECKSATGMDGKRISIGDSIKFRPYYLPFCPAVVVTGMHRQGASGTILTTQPAPDPDYPHHFGCRASRAVRVRE